MSRTEKLLKIEDVAECLQLSVGTVYHLISQKRIPVVRISSRCVRFRREDIEKWVEERAVKPDIKKG